MDDQKIEPAAPQQADSASFSRCAGCGHAADVNDSAGTLVCKKHNMLVNAEADEIPDDCAAFEASDDHEAAMETEK